MSSRHEIGTLIARARYQPLANPLLAASQSCRLLLTPAGAAAMGCLRVDSNDQCSGLHLQHVATAVRSTGNEDESCTACLAHLMIGSVRSKQRQQQSATDR